MILCPMTPLGDVIICNNRDMVRFEGRKQPVFWTLAQEQGLSAYIGDELFIPGVAICSQAAKSWLHQRYHPPDTKITTSISRGKDKDQLDGVEVPS